MKSREQDIERLLTDGLPGASVTFEDDAVMEYARKATLTLPGAKLKLTFCPDIDTVAIMRIDVAPKLEGKTFQKQGVAKKILSNLLAAAQCTGFDRINLYADDVGSYLWARAGFTPYASDMPSLCKELTKRIGELQAPEDERNALLRMVNVFDPKCLWRIADTKYGKEVLVDLNYSAQLDLYGDKEAKQRFEAYTTLSKEQQQAVATLLETGAKKI